jgi:hypothetical protein
MAYENKRTLRILAIEGVELLGFRSRKQSVRMGPQDEAIIDTEERHLNDGDWVFGDPIFE